MTIEDIKNISYQEMIKMNKDELYKTLRYAKQQSDKRITNYMKSNEKSRAKGKPEVYAETIENFLENRQGKFTGRLKINKKMTINEMRSELKRVQKLFSAKSGTIAGAKKLQKEKIQRIVSNFKQEDRKKVIKELNEWDAGQWGDYWKVYRRFMDNHGGELNTMYDSNETQEILTEIAVDEFSAGIDTIYDMLTKKMDQITRLDPFADVEGIEFFDVE